MPRFQFPTDLKYAKEASKKVLEALQDLNLKETVSFDIKLCLEEAFINAAKHGNQLDSHLTIDIDVVKRPEEIEIIVCDQGKGVDLENLDDPTANEHLTKTHGRGVFLIKKLMDEVRYVRDKGNCLHMIKKLKGITR